MQARSAGVRRGGVRRGAQVSRRAGGAHPRARHDPRLHPDGGRGQPGSQVVGRLRALPPPGVSGGRLTQAPCWPETAQTVSSPTLMAFMTAWVLLPASSFRKMRLRWLRTVLSLRPSFEAICLLESPRATRFRTLISRLESATAAAGGWVPLVEARAPLVAATVVVTSENRRAKSIPHSLI